MLWPQPWEGKSEEEVEGKGEDSYHSISIKAADIQHHQSIKCIGVREKDYITVGTCTKKICCMLSLYFLWGWIAPVIEVKESCLVGSPNQLELLTLSLTVLLLLLSSAMQKMIPIQHLLPTKWRTANIMSQKLVHWLFNSFIIINKNILHLTYDLRINPILCHYPIRL